MYGDVDNMEAWQNKIQQDVNEIKQGQTQLKNDVDNLKLNDKLQDQEISTLKATLSEIKEDTNWIRRKITGAIISAIMGIVLVGVMAGAIAKLLNWE